MFIGREKGPVKGEENKQLTIYDLPMPTRVGRAAGEVSTCLRYIPSRGLENVAIIEQRDPYDLICASAIGFAWIVTWAWVRKQFAVGKSGVLDLELGE